MPSRSVAPSAPASRALVSRELVSIDGIDGSGKSQLARALAAACEAEGSGPVTIFRVDDFRRPLGPLAPDADETAAYYDRYYDFAALDACLRAFLEGAAAARIAWFDPAREVVDGERELAFGPSRLGVLEGVFVLRSDVASRSPLIVLEVSEEEARRRIAARDAARGRPPEVIEHRIAKRYFPSQERYRAAFDPVGRADLLLDNQDWDRPRILRHVSDRLPPVVDTALRRVIRS